MTAADAVLRRVEAQPLEVVGVPRGILTGTAASVREVWRRRELVGLLVKRELRARYKNSSLGFVWSLLRPIAQLTVYYLIIGQLLRVGQGVPDFGIYIFAGLTAWTFFHELVSTGTGSIVANAGLVKKVYLPREVFPLSAAGASLVTLTTQLGILLLGTAVAGAFPFWTNVLYVPLGLLVVLTFGTALALFLSAVNVYLRDVQHLVEIAMLLLFWASPVIYTYSYVHDFFGGSWLEELYLANPVTLGVLAFQKGTWVAGADQAFPDHLGLRLAIATAVSLVLIWAAQRVFARLQGNFAQEL